MIPSNPKKKEDESRRANRGPPQNPPKKNPNIQDREKGKQTVSASGAKMTIMTMVTTTTNDNTNKERDEKSVALEKRCVCVYICITDEMEWSGRTRPKERGWGWRKASGWEILNYASDLYSSSLQGTPYAKSGFPILFCSSSLNAGDMVVVATLNVLLTGIVKSLPTLLDVIQW